MVTIKRRLLNILSFFLERYVDIYWVQRARLRWQTRGNGVGGCIRGSLSADKFQSSALVSLVSACLCLLSITLVSVLVVFLSVGHTLIGRQLLGAVMSRRSLSVALICTAAVNWNGFELNDAATDSQQWSLCILHFYWSFGLLWSGGVMVFSLVYVHQRIVLLVVTYNSECL